MIAEVSDLPDGWELQPGAGGWRCINPARHWETIVYWDDPQQGPGQQRAVAAAVSLQARTERTLRDQQQLCVELQACFTETDCHVSF